MKYLLLLKDGRKVKGILIQHDILKELVWRCGDDIIFECEVERAIIVKNNKNI